ncbi:MAG: metallophosphoesterase [Firmicutes bacterium]|nr:metallophosphoesterase [Bacillota bacterium]
MFSEKFFNRQIDKALENAPVLSTAIHRRMVVFSDCHRGCGNWTDSFLPNKTIYEAALTYYFNNDFTYIELGDGDELWENRRFVDIAEVHRDIFGLLERFNEAGRLFMVWGNHDRIKSRPGFGVPPLPPVSEGVIIRPKVLSGHGDYHLIHGHQADPLNNQFWKLSRWLVRYFWRPLELCGFKDPTSAAKNYNKGKMVEQRLMAWCRTNSANLVAGHTHRPALHSSESGWRYCNTGSCVHPGTITCIEIDRGRISLIKWATCADASQYIHVCRHVIGGPYDM